MARELPADPSGVRARDAAENPLAFIGTYADEPELIDAICEDAMNARERDPLRVASG